MECRCVPDIIDGSGKINGARLYTSRSSTFYKKEVNEEMTMWNSLPYIYRILSYVVCLKNGKRILPANK